MSLKIFCPDGPGQKGIARGQHACAMLQCLIDFQIADKQKFKNDSLAFQALKK
jgi:hypothetical protein